MTQSSSFFQSTRSSAAPYGAAIYTHPIDVTSNPKLTTAERGRSWLRGFPMPVRSRTLLRCAGSIVVLSSKLMQFCRRWFCSMQEQERT